MAFVHKEHRHDFFAAGYQCRPSRIEPAAEFGRTDLNHEQWGSIDQKLLARLDLLLKPLASERWRWNKALSRSTAVEIVDLIAR